MLERAKGIEPSYAAWEAAVLPLNYARKIYGLARISFLLALMVIFFLSEDLLIARYRPLRQASGCKPFG